MFGNQWTNSYGEWDEKNPSIAIWGAALKDISSDQFQNGLVALSNSGSTYNPTAPQFKKMCIGESAHPEHIRMTMANSNRKALPKPQITKEIGFAAFAEMKKNMRIK
jgi:hypothetical protein